MGPTKEEPGFGHSSGIATDAGPNPANVGGFKPAGHGSLSEGQLAAGRCSSGLLGGSMSDPNKPWGYQPYAGSTWATNNDAGIAYNIARRRAQGLPDFDATPPTRGQTTRRAILARVRLTTSSAVAAVLALLFVIAGFSVIASHPLGGIVGIAIGVALLTAAVRRGRRARQLWGEKIDGV